MRRVITVAWKTVCSRISHGGLGLRTLRSINDAALLKLGWDFYSSTEQWASFFKSIFLQDNWPTNAYNKYSIWPGLKRHLPTILENSSW